MTINVTTDTSVLIKGLVPPRRRLKDQIFSEQLDLHLRSTEILNKVERGDYSKLYPDLYLLKRAIEIGKNTKASGFDVLFIACAEASGSILFTDD